MAATLLVPPRRPLLLARAWPVLLGLGAAALVGALQGLSPKYLVAVPLGLAALTAALLVRDTGRLGAAAVVVLALGIPFNLDRNFFYRPHVGGAPGISIALTDLAAGGLCLLWAYRYLTGQDRYFLRLSPLLVWPQVLLIAAGALSLVNAVHPELVVFELIRLFKLLLLLIVVMSLRHDGQMRAIVAALSFAVLVQGVLAAVQYKWGSGLGLALLGEQDIVEQQIGYTAHRATGTIGHPNVLAYFFEILVPLMLAVFLVETGRRRQAWYLVVIAAGLVGVFTTLSRAAWIALPCALAVVYVVLRGAALKTLRTWMQLGLLAVVGLGAVAYGYPTIERRLTGSDQRSAESRVAMAKAALSIVEKYPIAGVGLNNCAEVFRRYDTTGYARILRERQVVHNLYLLVWVEMGTVGLLAFLSIFATAFWAGIRIFRRETPERRAVLVGVLAGLGAHLVHGLFDPGFKPAANLSMLVYLCLGLVGYLRLSHRPAAAGLPRVEGR